MRIKQECIWVKGDICKNVIKLSTECKENTVLMLCQSSTHIAAEISTEVSKLTC